MQGALVALKPEQKKAKEFVGFRCPPEDRVWLEAQGELSSSIRWAIGLAREYYEAVKPLHRRIEELAKAEGFTTIGLVARIMRRGLEEVETELKAAKK